MRNKVREVMSWFFERHPGVTVDQATNEIMFLMPNRKRIARIISSSSLWVLGKNAHQALSELTESIMGELE